MADKVLFQSGDDLSEQNITEAFALENQTDYVVRGLGLTADHTAETLDIGSGMAVIETSSNVAYHVYPDARTDLGLDTTTGVNHVYLEIDDATDDDVSVDINASDTPPTNPSLKIGTVDAGNDTHTEHNRHPDVAADRVTTKSQEVTYKIHETNGEWLADGDGEYADQSGSSFVGVLQAAVDAIDGEGGHIRLNVNDEDASKIWDGTLDITDKAASLTISGLGYRSTRIKVVDGLDANAIEWDGSAASGDDFGFTLRDMVLVGNKDNNASGHGLAVLNADADNQLNDVFITRFFVDEFADDGIHTTSSWGWKLDSMYSERHGGKGLYASGEGSNLKAFNSKFLHNESINVHHRTPDGRFVGCTAGGTEGTNAWFLNGSAQRTELVGCKTDSTTDDEVVINNNECAVNGGWFQTVDVQGERCDVDPTHVETVKQNGSNVRHSGSVADSYTGDGTTGRLIQLDFMPTEVLVWGSDGTLYEVRRGSGNTLNGATPSGELSIANNGFTVGDNGGDADPNTDGETYDFEAR